VSHGYFLLSKTYVNAREYLRYRCPQGHEGKIIFDSFRRGHRCAKCSLNKKSKKQSLNIDEVKRRFRINGCCLLSDSYKNSSSKLKFRCKCGNISYITLCNFMNRKRCGQCGLNARKGESHYGWRVDRKKKQIEDTIRSKSYKMLRYCLTKTGLSKKSKTRNILGYGNKELVEKITNHLNWEKVKDTDWHLDHIFPIKAFLDYGIMDLSVINHIDNLQPLLAKHNISKNSKYNELEFDRWLKIHNIRRYAV